MALETTCSTPGANYSIHILPYRIEVAVDLPREFYLTDQQSARLERTIHNAMEMVLTPLFVVDVLDQDLEHQKDQQ